MYPEYLSAAQEEYGLSVMCETICNLKEMVTADSRQLWEKLYYTTGTKLRCEKPGLL